MFYSSPEALTAQVQTPCTQRHKNIDSGIMALNDYRMEVKVSRDTKAQLERLRQEFNSKSSKKVTMSALVSGILASYLERLPSQEVEEKKFL